MKSLHLKTIIFCLSLGVLLVACKKEITRVEPNVTGNPYDNIDYGGGEVEDEDIDSSSFLGLHKFIFTTKCAVPACHDGSFEPDFRTVQSAYNTLVYHPPVKELVSGKTFDWRVKPNTLDSSLLHERITTTDGSLGKMPLYDTMYDYEIQKIKNWINNGAPDVFGNLPQQANLAPTFFGVLAYAGDTSGYRLDTTRRNFVEPMRFPDGTLVNIWFGLYDPQHTDGNFGLGYLLSYNKWLISENPYDFSGATEMSLSVSAPLSPHYGPTYFDPRPDYPYYHSMTIDTDDYVRNKVYYLRTRVKDVSHATYTEIPEDGSPEYLYLYFSFYVD